MSKHSDLQIMDEAQLRMLLEACGLRKSTTEKAVALRRTRPVNHPKPPSPMKGKRRKSAIPQGGHET